MTLADIVVLHLGRNGAISLAPWVVWTYVAVIALYVIVAWWCLTHQ